MHDHVDYTPLQKQVSFKEASEFKISRGKLPQASWLAVVLAGLLVVYLLTKVLLVGVVLLLIMGGGLYGAYLTYKKKEVQFKAFADANGFEYISGGEPGVETGSVFEAGHNRHAKRIVHGTYNNFPFWFGTYIYSTGVAANSRTMKLGVMSIQLDSAMPHILIDSGLQSLATAKTMGEFIPYENVEPSFSEIYNLLYKKEDEAAMLSIVTPDLMHTLRNEVLRKVDIEIRGDRMYIYTGMRIEPEEKTIKTIFTILDHIPHRA